MKRAVILHGTDALPMSGWRPWLKDKLEAEGYEVWVPALPGNHTPNAKVYNDFLLTSGWDFTNNIVIGHSSGAVEVLNLLMDERCPKVKLAIPVSVWNEKLIDETPEDTEQFKDTFPADGFDFERIKMNAEKIVLFIMSSIRIVRQRMRSISLANSALSL